MNLFYRILGLKLPPAKETAKNIMSEEKDNLDIEEQPNQEEHLVTLYLGLLPNGNTNIYFSWKEDTEQVAILTGEFLNKLVTGGYTKSFQAILENYGTSNVVVRNFIDNIFKSWSAASSIKNKKPMIKPRDVLKIAEGEQ